MRNLCPDNRWLRAFYMLDTPFDTVTEVEQPPAACLMLRRSLFGREPLFDERFPIFYNDVDLCRRLSDDGRRLRVLPEAEVLHHGGAGGVGALPDQGVADCLIGLVRYYRKHDGLVAAALLWSILTLNSLLVLAIGFGKVACARRPLSWWTQEAAKRENHPLDRWEELTARAAAGKFPKPTRKTRRCSRPKQPCSEAAERSTARPRR